MPFANSSMPEVEASVSSVPLSVRSGFYEICKRLFDVLASIVVIIGFAPIWALLAGLIKLGSPGPVFFTPEVVGWKGQCFRLVKFRSMVVGAQSTRHMEDVRRNFLNREPAGYDIQGRPIFKTSAIDPAQITGVGRWLRRFSLDEIPQFWNVLRGDMSIVGPRPALPYEAELYRTPQSERFAVRPGITGLYQVTVRNRIPIEEMIQIDLEYIRRRSVSLDLLIMLKTPFAMLKGM